MTLDQVKSDLKEIQYNYAKQKKLDGASRTIGASKITKKVELYNEAVRNAPVKLYEVYVSLYVNNNTQLTLSFDWDCSLEYVKRMTRKLRLFLKNQLEGGEQNGCIVSSVLSLVYYFVFTKRSNKNKIKSFN